jgi:hypothetical protein
VRLDRDRWSSKVSGTSTGWTRVYEYLAGTDKLRHTRAPSEPSSVADCGYGAHGNMKRMPHLAVMTWDAVTKHTS